MILNVTKECAREIVLEVKGLEAYMDAFLIIHNNARDERAIYCVENDSGNNIYVTVRPQDEQAARDWLEGFGTIKRVQDVLVLVADTPDFDYDKYDDCKIVFDD